jgi:branched-chain amino acid transport system ATP-binding protein
VLEQRHAQLAGTLSGGEQQILSISRALLAQPTVLLLDEPSMGLAPLVVEKLFLSLAEYRKDQDLSVILVEQDTELALELSDYAYVMEQGRVRLSGASKEIVNLPELRDTYLGVS